MSKHEGWENYETWHINLIIMNEYPLYLLWVKRARTGPFTNTSAKEFAGECFPKGYTADKVSIDDPKIFWQELAEAWNTSRAEITNEN